MTESLIQRAIIDELNDGSDPLQVLREVQIAFERTAQYFADGGEDVDGIEPIAQQLDVMVAYGYRRQEWKFKVVRVAKDGDGERDHFERRFPSRWEAEKYVDRNTSEDNPYEYSIEEV